jgi:hypothetical protein
MQTAHDEPPRGRSRGYYGPGGKFGELLAEVVAFRWEVIEEFWDTQRWEAYGGGPEVWIGCIGFRGACPECHGVLEVKFSDLQPLRAGARCLDNDCRVSDRVGV